MRWPGALAPKVLDSIDMLNSSHSHIVLNPGDPRSACDSQSPGHLAFRLHLTAEARSTLLRSIGSTEECRP